MPSNNILLFFSNLDTCKDILIVLDTSSSIVDGNTNRFKDNIKPFLKSLVKSPKLNVSPNGTWLSFFTFSSVEKTKLRLAFDPKTKQDYIDFINSELVFRKIYGTSTLTGTAAKIVEETVCPL